MRHANSKDVSLIIIRALALALFLLATIIASVNYGFVARLSPEAQHAWKTAYFYFEYFFRAFTVLLGAFLTYRYARRSAKAGSRELKFTLASFSVSSLLLLVILPLAMGYWEIYYALMPFPWTTMPIQLAVTGESFGATLPDWRGIPSATVMIWAYLLYQGVTLVGTMIMGRKFHCSMICMLNGCHAETLGVALPLPRGNATGGSSKRIAPGLRKVLIIVRNIIFVFNIVLFGLWIVYLIAGKPPVPVSMMLRAETIKYVALELGLLMALWFVIGGRAYCYYCPAGLTLAFLSKAAGQRVETGLTRCTRCGACDRACKMSIDIMAKAAVGAPVNDLSCVGCGLCVDACPTKNLRYRTRLWGRNRG